MTSLQLSPEARALLLEQLRLADELDRRKRENRLATYRPYAKQKQFHSAGAAHLERLFMAGNQLGKTFSGGAEAAYHATGLYPDWWDGRRFDGPTKGWASGITGESTRDNPQRILLGEPGQFGTGAIPKKCIVKITMARGVPNLVDSVLVRHASGGISRLAFKSYEKGREKWQGETLHWIWFDEEPPLDIYTEGLTRTNVTGGITFVTFTPLLGMSDTVLRFIGDGEAKSPGTHVTNMTIEDAEHYTPERRAAIVASYPAHEREARAKGVPILGSGRVFPVSEEAITVDPIRIPDDWAQIGGLDFGWDHPTAAVRLCWDRDADCVYVTHIHRLREATPVIHAATLKPWGDWLPWAWPHDGLQHDKGSGDQLAKLYRDQGLKMLPERATFPDGSNGLEAGVIDMLERMQTGRLKVFSTLTEWFEEFRMYHRKNGLITKQRDDLMCLHPDSEVITRDGVQRIASLVGTAGEVLTTKGEWTEYHDCRRTRTDAELVKVVFSDGHELLCTPDHKLLSHDGEWVCAIDSSGMECHDALSYQDGSQWKTSGTKTRSIRSIIGVQTATMLARAGDTCTALCTKITSGLSRRALLFTTSTATAQIFGFSILSQCTTLNMPLCTIKAISGTRYGCTKHRKNGENQRLARLSFESPAYEITTSCKSFVSSLANAAERISLPLIVALIGFAPTHASPDGGDRTAKTRLTRSARYAQSLSAPINSALQSAVRAAVGGKCGYQQPRAAHTLSVLRVQSVSQRSDVYCMEVPKTEAFALCNGAVVHNCSTRYGLMMLRRAKTKPKKVVKSVAPGSSGPHGWMGA